MVQQFQQGPPSLEELIYGSSNGDNTLESSTSDDTDFFQVKKQSESVGNQVDSSKYVHDVDVDLTKVLNDFGHYPAHLAFISCSPFYQTDLLLSLARHLPRTATRMITTTYLATLKIWRPMKFILPPSQRQKLLKSSEKNKRNN